MIKKCLKCGAMVEVLKDCTCDNCGIKCCGEQMVELKENSVECAVEKHLPVVEVKGKEIMVSVPHVMEDDHYIAYLALEDKNYYARKNFLPTDKPVATFPYMPGSKVISYCNKHGLWSTIVK